MRLRRVEARYLGSRKSVLMAVFAVLLMALAPIILAADDAADVGDEQQTQRGRRTAPVTPFAIDVDVRDLPEPQEWEPGDPIKDIPRRFYLPPGTVLPSPVETRDPLADLQLSFFETQRGSNPFTVPSRNFPGNGFNGIGVPDTIGDVGMNYVIQAINSSRIQIWDKATPQPSLLATFQLDSLGTGACANGLGDPVVIYDRNAQRWVLMEFVSGGTNLCVYVSQTPDPVSGGWYAYNFVPPSFPDYPKLGVWPTDLNDGGGSYVVTANAGVAVYAMERGKMLTGDTAGFQIFDLPSLPGFGFQTTTPADIDGPDLPPSGAPAVVMRQRDTEVHSGPPAPGDLLEMWALNVDWETSSNSTIAALPSIDVAEFSSALCGLTSFSCFPQPNSGTTLDPLREVIMNRLQYMNHGGEFETLVGNFVVDVDGNDLGGIRWFDLRRTAGAQGSWFLNDEGTYTIDDDNRWMGGSSMDQSGNIALAYNVSSSSTFPALRYTGRRSDDPPGVMTAPETSIVEGNGSNFTNRYGDYAAMGLDPADDCTFWFTGEYNPSSQWSTRWASFAFEECGCLLEPLPPTLDATSEEDNRVDLVWSDSELAEVIEYEVRRSRTDGGPYETIARITDTSPGVSDGPDYFYADLDVSGGFTYYYVVVAGDGGACKSNPQNQVAAFPQGRCFLPPIFDGITSAQIDFSDTCGIRLDWNPATPECGAQVLYNLYRSTDPGFVPGPTNLLAGGISDSTTLDQNDIAFGFEYFYVVRAIDTSNLVEELNAVTVSAVAGGAGGAQTQFFEAFEDRQALAAWTVTTGPGPHGCGEWDVSTDGSRRPAGGSGQFMLANSFDCAPILSTTSASLDSPPFDFSDPSLAAVILEFDIYYNHFNGDDATVEVWDGSQWVVIWTDPNSDVNTKLSFDVSAYALGNTEFRVRFDYQNALEDRWFSIDNMRIGVDLVCGTGPAPNPAPAGDAGTTPLHAVPLTLAADTIDVTWDATSCGSGVFNLLYGDLAGVANYALSGSECAIGNAGSFTWNAVPPGSLYFLIVGGDGNVTESSWGQSSFGERNGLSASGECGLTNKIVAATCPTN
jgi:hypothetical protein